ncbi:HNH endonuclease [Streptomyces halstedii]|uniref:HNH endonuclease n=1 Tax=Streptomyces halstedii TaxID=1944 RepID=UPI003460363E
MSTRHLTASLRRQRKEQLARRHGARCTYCHRPFASLREATLDHIAPRSLFPTWSVVHLTLACQPCNHTKADRLPLSLALLILWTLAPDRLADHPVNVDVHGSFTALVGQAPDAHTEAQNPQVEARRTRMNSAQSPTAFTPIDWRLLARLAHAHQSTTATREQACEHGEQTRERSGRRREHRPPTGHRTGRPTRPTATPAAPKHRTPDTRSLQHP